MGTTTSDLVVRGSDRYQCDLAATITIAQIHSKLVKPDKSAPGGGGPVDCRVVDLSSGGAGLRCTLFLPQACHVSLSIREPGIAEPLTVDVRVQRVMMLDRTPTYYLGTAFESLPPELAERVAQAVDRLKVSGAAQVPEKPRA